VSSNHIRSLGSQIAVDIPTDDDGYTGRECPNEACLGYFKVKGGTGLKGITTCVCPYCGAKDEHNRFWTPDQIEYAKSVAMRRIADAFGDVPCAAETERRSADHHALFLWTSTAFPD
jgi:hypothetical protein